MTKKTTQRFEFTDKAIEALPIKKSQYIVWDISIRRLACKINATGGKFYHIRYSKDGKTKYQALGRACTFPIANVRKRALAFEMAILEKKDIQEVANKFKTVSELFEEYLKTYLSRKASKHTCAMAKGGFYNHFAPRFGNISIPELKRKDVEDWVASMEHIPIACNLILSTVSMMYTKALDWDFLDSTHQNPIARIKRYPGKVRNRPLTLEEMQIIMEELNKNEHILSYVIKFLIHSGLRKKQVLNLRWDQVIKNDEGIYRLNITAQDTKGRHALRTPLSDLAGDILDEMKKRNACDKYVFINPATKNPFIDVGKFWDKFRTKTNLEDLHIHDFRHNFASKLVEDGMCLAALNKLLGHATIVSTLRYTAGADFSFLEHLNAINKLF